MSKILGNYKLVKSPLNFTGGKYRLLNQLLPLFPKEINTMVDLFSGGSNVGANVEANKIISIDNQKELISLFNSFLLHRKENIFQTIFHIIDTYNLSNSSKYGYEYYGCNSMDGLGSYNKSRFTKLREDYNGLIGESFYKDMMFYTITIYAFNNQIRFNNEGKCNIPVGKRDFNNNLQRNLSKFIDRIKSIDIEFHVADFIDLDIDKYDEKDLFFYVDPPYLIAKATYNEKNGWNVDNEEKLLRLLDQINSKGIKFALSNIIENNDRRNIILEQWSRKYKVHYLDYSYRNSNYQKNRSKNKSSKTMEVLVTNY
ncbi:Dam family site-specific DNA-(adenine-N6)-methyltransferase [Clostridium sp. Cult2]|uniref:Dam family site-specific DNA-(adenine-N6)-methyltransferase n=1 Tax=Clostridium sp. Cult2 TaxID=2079003 RepID=UPI001F00693B|nr:Dam family site-specific DNA-(adenine-N6)-methyltransferase [Clostridium sp. Cult2]